MKARSRKRRDLGSGSDRSAEDRNDNDRQSAPSASTLPTFLLPAQTASNSILSPHRVSCDLERHVFALALFDPLPVGHVEGEGPCLLRLRPHPSSSPRGRGHKPCCHGPFPQRSGSQSQRSAPTTQLPYQANGHASKPLPLRFICM